MPLTLIVKADEQVARSQREMAAQRVLDCFGLQLPDRRLLCFLDSQEWQAFKTENGIANRGFYSRVKASHRHWRIAPTYILESVFPNGVLASDDFIYLHGSTCSNEVSLTMTLAHELQHFVQCTDQGPLWAANTLIPCLTKAAIKDLGLKWCDIPHEREARIVSKRIAEDLFGGEAVRNYIGARIAERMTAADAADWECIKGLVTSTPYDLASETKLFFPRLKGYRPQLKAALRHFRSDDPDFAEIDLDSLLSGTSG
jgi:hypothetical protein